MIIDENSQFENLFPNTQTKTSHASYIGKKPLIKFWDFKGYWEDVLDKITEWIITDDRFSQYKAMLSNEIKKEHLIKIETWDIDYNSYDSVVDNKGKLLSTPYNNETLHVFVAPITWAGLYTKPNNFIILGPAFATYGDIKLYNLSKRIASKNDNNRWTRSNHKKRENIKIAIVDELATSTIGLKIIMNGICRQLGSKGDLIELVSEKNGELRSGKLDNNEVLAAVFNENETGSFPSHTSINAIVDIDELYALAKKISNLPRVVYAISRSQIEDIALADTINNLKLFFNKIKSTYANAASNKHILPPFDDAVRYNIIDFLKDGQKVIDALKDYKTENLQFMKI